MQARSHWLGSSLRTDATRESAAGFWHCWTGLQCNSAAGPRGYWWWWWLLLYKHYSNHNQTLFTLTFPSPSRDLREKKLFSSSSSSCHGSDVTWQEIGRMCGSVATEVELTTSKPFTRSQRLSSLSEQSKSALTDQASHDNCVINWSESTVLDRESNRGTIWIKEAVHWTEGQRSVNWVEGSYTLSHMYDPFLATSHHYRGKNPKKNWTAFSDEGLW